MAFDYATAPEAFAYGGSAGLGTDPVDEAAVMADAVTAVSRGIDRLCLQEFSAASHTLRRLRGVVDRDGVLTCYPPCPTVTALAAMEYRAAGATTWQSAGGTLDYEDRAHGAVVRCLGLGLLALRGGRVDVRLTYAGGYATRADLPDDLAWAARAAAWYEFQRRAAPQDRTAMPALGVVVIPGDWPRHITERLARYRKVTPT